jgi:MFS superfamily sulfate permease-like transporter
LIKPHEQPISERLRKDLPSSLVVFLVALPLCLGIALASDAPPFAGIIAGVVGGIVVGYLSGSQLSVSGPAAGLTVVVADSIRTLGSYEAFLSAVCLASLFQILLGIIKAGLLANFFPSSVIKAMLAAIGILLILKQIPHALGYDFDYVGDESFQEKEGHNTFSDIWYALKEIHFPAFFIAISSLAVMVGWDQYIGRIRPMLKLIPGALLAVLTGMGINWFFDHFMPEFNMGKDYLVNLPTGGVGNISSLIQFPDFNAFGNPKLFMVALTIAIIASIESLLSIEATDRLDPYKRASPLNKELIAQGVGNFFSGMLGGLPVTAVIVRSSANIVAGAVSKLSTILHGFLLLFSVFMIPGLLNLIPLASLASILFVVGYKLTKPSLFKSVYMSGLNQFIPFIVTIVSIVLTDLLKGIAIGSAVGLFFVAISNFKRSITVTRDHGKYLIRLRYNVSFLNKSILREILAKIPDDTYVIIDGTNALFIDQDIMDTIDLFISSVKVRGIQVELKKTKTSQNEYFRTEETASHGNIRETPA